MVLEHQLRGRSTSRFEPRSTASEYQRSDLIPNTKTFKETYPRRGFLPLLISHPDQSGHEFTALPSEASAQAGLSAETKTGRLDFLELLHQGKSTMGIRFPHTS
jgi:hypothetical protein